MQEFERLDAAVEDRLDASIDELRRFCAQPSIAAQDEGMGECAQLVRGMLQSRGFETQFLDVPGHPVLYAHRPGRSGRTLLLYNHYDVQPPEPLDLWHSPPFEPRLQAGKLFARGVSDDKGHLMCRLAAIDAWLEVEGELPCNVKFLIEGEEEIGSPNLAAVVAAHRELLAADACLWEFGGVDHEGRPLLYAGLRGICYVELRARTASQDAHSGLGGSIFPNAAWRLTWALATIKDPGERIQLPGFYDAVKPPTPRDRELIAALPMTGEDLLQRYDLPSFLGELEPGPELSEAAIFQPSCTICGLQAGYGGSGAKTVLPAEALAKVDFRLVPDQDPYEVVRTLRDHLQQQSFTDIEIELLGAEHPGRTDPDHPFLQMVSECARDVYGMPQIIQPLAGGSGPIHPFLTELEVPVATVGVSYPGANIHAPNENIRVDDFVAGTRHTVRVLSRFADSS